MVTGTTRFIQGRQSSNSFSYYLTLPKLIVATDEGEVPQLSTLLRQGTENGVRDLRFMDLDEMRRIEPSILGVMGLYSPNSGIVDSHGLMGGFYNIARSLGAVFSFNSTVVGIDCIGGKFKIRLAENGYQFFSRIVINCAGLHSDRIAELCGIDREAFGYRLHWCKGSYFSCKRTPPLSVLVYPVPQSQLEGLGVHATIDLAGRLRFGPDTEYVNEINYSVDEQKIREVHRCANKIIRGISIEDLSPDQAGIRPKLQAEGQPFRDFVIAEESERGIPGLLNLIGIESPGLTACQAIAEHVAAKVRPML